MQAKRRFQKVIGFGRKQVTSLTLPTAASDHDMSSQLKFTPDAPAGGTYCKEALHVLQITVSAQLPNQPVRYKQVINT